MDHNFSKDRLLLDIIKKYIACANYVCRILIDEFKVDQEPLLNAYRDKIIPKEGFLYEHKLRYSFHGGGCYFEFEDGTIDINFGPQGRFDGFDLYTLLDFIRTNKLLKLTSIDKDEIEKQLVKLEKNRLIWQPKIFPNPELFYLKE